MTEIARSQDRLLVNDEEIVMQQQEILHLALRKTRRAKELKGEFSQTSAMKSERP